MTIQQAISRIDTIMPNGYSTEEKVRWLSELDGKITREIINVSESGKDTTFTPYNEQTEESKQLIVEAPYDEMYIKWLESQIEYSNGEYNKYNNSITLFNSSLMTYANMYNKKNIAEEVAKFKYF